MHSLHALGKLVSMLCKCLSAIELLIICVFVSTMSWCTKMPADFAHEHNEQNVFNQIERNQNRFLP